MKISKLIIAFLFATSIFAITPARADDNHGDDKHEDGGNGNGGSNLPIDNQAWFLIIAGAGIGARVLISKTKEAKLQNSTL